MNGIGRSAKPSQDNGRVFVSLPKSFPSQWTGLIHRRATDLGLAAFVYHGIPQSPFQQINNAEYEARADMYSAQFVFAAFVNGDAEELDGIWIVKYVPKLMEYGIKFDLALVSRDATDFNAGRNAMSIPIGIKVSNFTKAEEWLAFFTDEMHKCVPPFPQRPI